MKTSLFAAVSLIGISVFSGGALAADPFVDPGVDWSGFYAGVQLGYQWGDDHTEEFITATGLPSGFDQDFDPEGVVGGIHAGYNFQTGSIVWGIEADLEASDFDGGYTLANGNGTDFDSNWQGSVRARVGLPVGSALIYATGGLAVAELEYAYFTPVLSEDFSSTEVGWTAGGGAEWMFNPSWTTRIEYRYTDYGNISNNSTVAFPGFTYEHDPSIHSVRLGVSYLFGN